MRASEYLKRYALSPLGIGSLGGGAVLGAALAAAGLGPLLSALSGAGLVLLCGLAGLLSGAGPRQAVAGLEAARLAEGRKRLAAAAEARSRLARLRLSDPGMAAAVDLVVLAGGEYLEACAREGGDDPLADAALDEALEVVDIWQKESDEAAVERRYALPDADPFADASGRGVQALRAKAAFLRQRRLQIDGGLPPAERMEITEELK